MKYMIVETNRPLPDQALFELEEAVGQQLDGGWVPVGGVSLIFHKLPPNYAGEDYYIAIQAMTLSEI